VLLGSRTPTVEEFREATGWKLEPQGACKGEVCVPLGPEAVQDGRVALDAVADRLGMAVVGADRGDLVAVGPESFGGRALSTVEAPDLELPDFDGHPFRLASLRGTKVVLVAWAPY
jgi:hypothetical protein